MFLFYLCFLLPSSLAYFTKDFNDFLVKTYGRKVKDVLQRSDFGSEGSFGGRNDKSDQINHQPVVLVHGVVNVATRFLFMQIYLRKKGYTSAEVRVMIQAVHLYTQRKVNILAYSMGSPVARHAILGGFCESENIGPPLTDLVDTFVGVAGANFGSYLCFIPLFICSRYNGLHCRSKALENLNTQKARYEGKYSFAIYSDADDKVGIDCCGHNCSSIPHSNDEFILNGFNHDGLMEASVDLQYNLIQHHLKDNH